jgi:hypothetical protein
VGTSSPGRTIVAVVAMLIFSGCNIPPESAV